MGLIHVVHPDLPHAKSSRQDKTAFDQVWKAKGWIEINDEAAAAHNQAVDAGNPSPAFPTEKKGDK